MKVLLIHNKYRHRGGEDGVFEAESELLRRHGHEVEQLVAENPESSTASAAALLRSSWNSRSARLVGDHVSTTAPDVVHFHNVWFVLTSAAIDAAARLRPTFVTLHNYRLACITGQFRRDDRVCTDCLGTSPRSGIVHGCYRGSRTLSVAAAASQVTIRRSGVLNRPGVTVLVHTPFSRDVAIQSGVDPERILIHENFVDDPGPRTTAPTDSDEVLFVGRLASEKGVDRVISMWGGARGDLRLTVIGDGPEAASLTAAADRTAGVEMAGRLEPHLVRRRMLSARCLVVPSQWFESQPLVILEALAAGLPVIASDWPPIRAVLEGMPAGALTAPDQWGPEVLARLEDDDWVSASSQAARALYVERFSPDVAHRRLTDIYRNAVEPA